jgi:TatA/E family protein of Tat protein translocase
MFGMGMPEIILILAIALIVLGPKKLPEIAKSLGRGIAEFRKATQDFKENLQVDNDLKEAGDSIRQVKEDLEETVRKSMNGTTTHQKTAAEPGAKIEQPIEKDATGESEASIEGRPRQETPSKEPAEDA